MENHNINSTLAIEDSVRELAVTFAERFSEIEIRFPKLRYDFTFPSIGNVERALAHLRFNNSLSNKEEELLRGASAYLAMIAAHAWASVPDDLNVSAKVLTSGDISLRVEGGTFLKAGAFSVGVLSSLKRFLSSKEEAFFEGLSKKFSLKDPVVEPFMLGLVSGLCPSGVGPWKDLSASEFAVYIEPMTKFLARTTAQYYEKVFSDGSIDDLTELFLNSLTLPPHGFDEPFIGLRGATFLIEYLNKEGYSDKAQLELAQNLASMPTEQISTVGKIISLCLTEEIQVGKYQIDSRIRATVCTLRNRLFGETDWLTTVDTKKNLSNEEKELVQDQFQRERNQKLIPNIILPGRLILNEKCLPLLKTLAWNEIELAKKGCDSLLRTHAVDDFAILLQNVALLIETENLDEAVEKFSLATIAVSSASIDQSALFLQLGGTMAFRLGNYEEAFEYFNRGIRQVLFDTDDTMFGMLLRVLIAQEKFEEALKLGSEFHARFPSSADVSLPICVGAIQSNNAAIARELLSEVLWNDPNNQSAYWLALRI